jgi:NAD(P)-dependent dehydrogenase (short-subunit alcohol dehydrogenase family)
VAGPHESKVAAVTGGATGIGLEIAARLAEQGADVAVLDVADTGAAVERIEATGRKAVGVACDVTDVDSTKAAEQAVRESLGAASILVNNVGIYPYDAFAEMDLATWRKVMTINLDSVFIVSSAFVPSMRSQRWGRIVNLASNTFHGGDYPSYVHYIASKGGVIGFTRGLASELGPDGVTVNAVAPGLTATENILQLRPAEAFDDAVGGQAIKRRQEPRDVAGAVSFLASDDAEFITGQTLPVDGGFARV